MSTQESEHTTGEKARLLRGVRVLKTFMAAMPQAVVSDMAMLLSVSAYPGETMKEHGERVGMVKSSASIALRRLAQGDKRSTRKGMGWIAFQEDPDDERAKIPVLTPAGEAVVALLLDAIAPER